MLGVYSYWCVPLAGEQANTSAVDDAGDDEHGLVLDGTHDDGANDEYDTGQHHGISTTEVITDVGGKQSADKTAAGQGSHDAALCDGFWIIEIIFIL